MKNLLLTTAAALLLLTACSKEETFEPRQEQMEDTVYVLNQTDRITWEKTSLGLQQTGSNFTYSTDDPFRSVHTSGEFVSTSRNTNTITWSGTEHEGRIHGSAELLLSTPGYSLGLRLATECVMVEGNEAVYGGIVTEVLERSGNPPPFGVNWRFYFKVIDTGEGSSIGYDQISNTQIFAQPRSSSMCNVLLPGNSIWSNEGYEAVLAPGFVKVWGFDR